MTNTNINHCWGHLIIEELARLGCDYFCIAPGSRSSPLTVPAGQNRKIKTLVHFDERGLAFHALGYASATKKPAVLICTSGTAAANFLPAIVEASKKKVPLIVLTADRPPELRQTGAVQTIDQVGIYGKYVKYFIDLPCPDLNIAPEVVLTTVDQAWYQATRQGGVSHINCMFREPLAPIKTKDHLSFYIKALSMWLKSDQPYSKYIANQEGALSSQYAKEIVNNINSLKNGIIAVGKIGEAESALVKALSEKLGWPIFADLTSGMRLGSVHPNVIHYFDQALLSDKALSVLSSVDGVIHLGGRMTSKRYYEFVDRLKPEQYIMVLNHSLRNDPNHQVTLRVESSVPQFVKSILPLLKQRLPAPALKKLLKINYLIDKTIDDFIDRDERLTEIAVARLVSQTIPQGSGLFVSNSMPIRDMEFYGDFKCNPVVVGANRGASGIDGIIASAAGFAYGLSKKSSQEIPTTLMIGDLAFLHDLNSLSMLRDLKSPFVIVVLNNGGGGIFSFLPIARSKDVFEKYYGTPHSYTFSNVAAAFELNYDQIMDKKHFSKVYKLALKSQTSTIIEVVTSREENFDVHKILQEKINGI